MRCSFCVKRGTEVERLIAGPTPQIPICSDTAGARLVAPDGADALREALSGLIEEAGEPERVVAISTAAAAGPYSWDEAARRTLARYEALGA